jgi:hypothetical protein
MDQRWLMYALNEYVEDWAAVCERAVGVPGEFVGDETSAQLELRKFVRKRSAPDIMRYCLFKIDQNGQPKLFYLVDVLRESNSLSEAIEGSH